MNAKEKMTAAAKINSLTVAEITELGMHLSKIAMEEVEAIEINDDKVFVYGTELAGLRLEHFYNDRANFYYDYCNRMGAHFFVMTKI